MLNLAIDIGNTYVKVGFFKDNTLTEVHTQLRMEALADLMNKAAWQAVIVSSVKPLPDELVQMLQSIRQVIYLSTTTRLPFTNLYHTPETLGTDRIAAVAGVSFLYPQTNALAIDAGTCVTYDFIDKGGRYHGGAISPGLQMRLNAMHTFTARLPLISTEEVMVAKLPFMGKSTRESMLSGAIHGTGSEITEMIRMYADKFADLQVVICGGDASCLTEVIRQQHTIIPELILIGLNRILIHNVS